MVRNDSQGHCVCERWKRRCNCCMCQDVWLCLRNLLRAFPICHSNYLPGAIREGKLCLLFAFINNTGLQRNWDFCCSHIKCGLCSIKVVTSRNPENSYSLWKICFIRMVPAYLMFVLCITDVFRTLSSTEHHQHIVPAIPHAELWNKNELSYFKWKRLSMIKEYEASLSVICAVHFFTHQSILLETKESYHFLRVCFFSI
jgi:hypothetical protein